MSADGSITLDWRGGRHLFRLGLGELRSLQELCKMGPFGIYNRLLDGTFRLEDAIETVRLGLIGGGLTPAQAYQLCEAHVHPPVPLAETALLAKGILMVAMVGSPEDPVGKVAAEAPGMDISSSPPSTETEQQWGLPLGK